jgi:D-alanyl-D-alanine carboxypeptidase
MHRLLILLLYWFLCGYATAATSVDAYIAEHARTHDFHGTIAVQKSGRIILARSYGMANLEHQRPNLTRTRYKIASITKLFTATLILQLRDQGKLDLGQPIRTYLPDYAGEGADKVNVHQLLNHTSGLPNFDQVKDAQTAIDHGIPTYQTPYSSDQLLAKFCSGNLVHAPGKAFDYNNCDYIVLGKIIERLHGKPYAQVLKERILQPLEMHDTDMLKQSDVIPGLANTYFLRDDLKALAPDLPVYPENWYAAGAMYATAGDLLKFSSALFAPTLISKESLALLLTPGLDDYGYGLWTYSTRMDGASHRVAKRPGQIMGTGTQLYRLLDHDITIVILSNVGNTDLDEFVAGIAKRTVI